MRTESLGECMQFISIIWTHKATGLVTRTVVAAEDYSIGIECGEATEGTLRSEGVPEGVHARVYAEVSPKMESPAEIRDRHLEKLVILETESHRLWDDALKRYGP